MVPGNENKTEEREEKRKKAKKKEKRKRERKGTKRRWKNSMQKSWVSPSDQEKREDVRAQVNRTRLLFKGEIENGRRRHVLLHVQRLEVPGVQRTSGKKQTEKKGGRKKKKKATRK